MFIECLLLNVHVKIAINSIHNWIWKKCWFWCDTTFYTLNFKINISICKTLEIPPYWAEKYVFFLLFVVNLLIYIIYSFLLWLLAILYLFKNVIRFVWIGIFSLRRNWKFISLLSFFVLLLVNCVNNNLSNYNQTIYKIKSLNL